MCQVVYLFQFQTGAIRRDRYYRGSGNNHVRFNSKLVRLEVVDELHDKLHRVESFNSKLVRLEVLVEYNDEVATTSFNSKLVRLEVSSLLTL